jgi:surface protein
MAPMKQKLTNDPLECFRTLPHGIKIKIYRFTVHVFDSRRELIEAVDLYVHTRYRHGRPYEQPRSWQWPHRPINEWDVSRVTDFSRVFHHSCNFRSSNYFYEDLSSWDVSNGTNFEGMFCGCLWFNGDVSKWNVSKATNLSSMFCRCPGFNGDVSQWDVSNATNLSNMFRNCSINADVSQCLERHGFEWHVLQLPILQRGRVAMERLERHEFE